MYRARDRLDNDDWIDRLEDGADALDLGEDARAVATELFLTAGPETDRSKRVIAAASLYAASLIASEERSQSAIAEEMDVARLSVQQHWKPLLSEAGFEPPDW